MVHELNTLTFNALSLESREKVIRIMDIAILRARMKARPISPRTFDRMYDASIEALDEHIHALSDTLDHIEGE